jgi:hypothetical protein
MANLDQPATGTPSRYWRDSAYRERVRAAARDSYRSRNPDTAQNVCADRLKQDLVATFGTTRRVVDRRGVGHTGVTFTLSEMAELTARSRSSLYRMVQHSMWPRPAHIVAETELSDSPTYVYTLKEAKALLTVFADHLSRLRLYRRDHTQTRDALFSAMKG